VFTAVNEQLATDRDYGDGPVLDRVSVRITGKYDQPVFDERTLNDQALVNVVPGEDLAEGAAFCHPLRLTSALPCLTLIFVDCNLMGIS